MSHFFKVIAILGLYFSTHSGVAAADSCSNSTLVGSYILAADGAKGASSSSERLAYVGMVVYDGKENAKFTASFADGSEATFGGTYSVDATCKGQVTYEGGRTAAYFVSPSGDELVYVLTNGSFVSSHAKRVSKDQLLKLDSK
jgi:hypothetical protein